MGIAGGVPVRCGIAIAAPVALQGTSLTGLEAMLATDLRNCERIHEIIERKYRAGLFEVGASVVAQSDEKTPINDAYPRKGE